MLLFIFFHIHTFLLVLGHKTNHSQSFNTAVYIASQSTSIQDKLRHRTQYMYQTYCQRQFLCVQGINKSSRLLSRKSFNTLTKNHQRSLAWILCECLLGFISCNDNISILSSLFPQFFGPGLCPLMFIIYSEPEFVGRDSCYKLLPQHFFVNFQIKSIKLCNELKVGATDLTEPAQTQISTFRFFTMKYQSSTLGPTGIKNWRSRWITDFNIQIFHNWNINPEHTYKYKGQQGSKSEQADW